MRAEFATMGFAPYPKAQLRAQLLQMRAERTPNMPLEAVEEIVDLACHAAETGRRAMLEVIDRASSWRIATTAIGPATSLLAHDLQLLTEGLQHAAAAAGLHHEIRNIGGQARG
jgi:hypothetical protein